MPNNTARICYGINLGINFNCPWERDEFERWVLIHHEGIAPETLENMTDRELEILGDDMIFELVTYVSKGEQGCILCLKDGVVGRDYPIMFDPVNLDINIRDVTYLEMLYDTICEAVEESEASQLARRHRWWLVTEWE